MSYLDLPAVGTGDLRVGAVLVLQDKRMVEILDVVRYRDLDAVERSFHTGYDVSGPVLGPIQFLAIRDELTREYDWLTAQDVSGARLLRAAPPADAAAA